jgi:hypothetical protein
MLYQSFSTHGIRVRVAWNSIKRHIAECPRRGNTCSIEATSTQQKESLKTTRAWLGLEPTSQCSKWLSLQGARSDIAPCIGIHVQSEMRPAAIQIRTSPKSSGKIHDLVSIGTHDTHASVIGRSLMRHTHKHTHKRHTYTPHLSTHLDTHTLEVLTFLPVFTYAS